MSDLERKRVLKTLTVAEKVKLIELVDNGTKKKKDFFKYLMRIQVMK